MTTTAEKRATLERLETMRNAGITSTSHDGVSTNFRSLSELNQTILRLKRELGMIPKVRRTMGVFMGHR